MLGNFTDFKKNSNFVGNFVGVDYQPPTPAPVQQNGKILYLFFATNNFAEKKSQYWIGIKNDNMHYISIFG